MIFFFNSILRKKTYRLIKHLGDGYNEIVIDGLIIDNIEFSSLELRGDCIYLNLFKGDLELKTDFDDLEELEKEYIYLFLKDIKKVSYF